MNIPHRKLHSTKHLNSAPKGKVTVSINRANNQPNKRRDRWRCTKGLNVRYNKKTHSLILAGLICFGISSTHWPFDHSTAHAAKLPQIRLSKSNRVPTCATPEALIAFTRSRNPDLHSRYNKIARWYRHWGNTWEVRWDYAYFQMLLETNYLKYKRGNGKRGDVKPNQYNFAGLGATGGGVPGNRFPDVKTGVLAQIQHLVAYSGQLMANPIAPRTKLAQSDIVYESKRLRRPVRFSDLTNRWAADRRYHHKIKSIADRFYKQYCINKQPARTQQPILASILWSQPPTWKPALSLREQIAPAPRPVPRRPRCQISKASYGGGKTLLIRSIKQPNVHYTALSVIEGFEQTMIDQFMKSQAQGGKVIGSFPSQAAALKRANTLCPTG